MGSSVISNVFGVLSLSLFTLVNVFRDNKPCVIVLQIITFEWLQFLHLSQIHSSRLSIFWLVSLLSFESLSGFHSVAVLVHVSGLRVAIRRACRHCSFFCFSTPFAMLCVRILPAASLALLFMCSSQSSKSFSWLVVLSSSSSNEILLSWSYSSFVLCSSYPSPLIQLVASRGTRTNRRKRHGSSVALQLRSPAWKTGWRSIKHYVDSSLHHARTVLHSPASNRAAVGASRAIE